MPIQSKDHANRLCTLVDDQGLPVEYGTKVQDYKGDHWAILGGTAPYHKITSGKVTASRFGQTEEFYASELDLSWQPETGDIAISPIKKGVKFTGD